MPYDNYNYLVLFAKKYIQFLETSIIYRRVNSNNGVFGTDSMATVSTGLCRCFLNNILQQTFIW